MHWSEGSSPSGGSGWDGSWTTDGIAEVVTTEDPAEGSYHARLADDARMQRRSVDLTGYTNAQLSLWCKIMNYAAAESTVIEFDDDITIHTLATFNKRSSNLGVYELFNFDTNPHFHLLDNFLREIVLC